MGVASTNAQFLEKLSKLPLAFSPCNYVTFRRTFILWQSMDSFYFLSQNPIFKNKAIVQDLVKKRSYELGNGIQLFNDRNYVCMS